MNNGRGIFGVHNIFGTPDFKQNPCSVVIICAYIYTLPNQSSESAKLAGGAGGREERGYYHGGEEMRPMDVFL